MEKIQSEEKVSEFLPKILEQLLKIYEFERLIYANGPGSYMGIKVSFLAFKTLSIVKNIKMYSVSGFDLCDKKSIKANNNLYFVLENGEICLKEAPESIFFIPNDLTNLKFSDDVAPFYFLDVI